MFATPWGTSAYITRMLRTVSTRDGIPQAGWNFANISVVVTVPDPMIEFSNASGVSALHSVLDCV